MSTINKIGDSLRKIRLQRGMTQAEVAEKAEVSPNYYARIERGDTKISLEIFEKVIKALKIKSSDVLPF